MLRITRAIGVVLLVGVAWSTISKAEPLPGQCARRHTEAVFLDLEERVGYYHVCSIAWCGTEVLGVSCTPFVPDPEPTPTPTPTPSPIPFP